VSVVYKCPFLPIRLNSFHKDNENDIVLDCFAGSETTLVASKNLNRQFIGIEKEKEYYDICLERLKEKEESQ